MSTEKPNISLTTLLGQLPKVRESGFTERVSYRLRLRELRRRAIFFTAWSCGLAGIALSLLQRQSMAPLTKLLQDSSARWTDLASANQLAHTLVGHLHMGNLNSVVALSAGAILIVFTTFSLLRD